MNTTAAARRAGIWLAGVLLVATSGCQPFDHYNTSLDLPANPAIEPPRELSKISLPTYRIEPPDVLTLEVLKLVPLVPYRIEPYDLLYVHVLGALPDQPINGPYAVDGEGRINLGPGYGLVRVAGMTLDEATRTVETHLRQYLRLPEVMVQQASPGLLQQGPQAGGPAGMGVSGAVAPPNVQQVSGQYLVAADGTVNLRQYGTVAVAGRTLQEARQLIEQQLGKFFDSPKVSLDVAAYNSKVYYIITSGAGLGDNVVRVPVMGNETVLDAVAQVQGLSQVSSKKIWVARPAPHGFHCEQVLPVDWDAVAQGGSVSTNYQVLPGDRVYIASDEAVTFNNWLNKMISPVERVLGFSSLTASTIRNFKFINRDTSGTGF